MRPRVSILNLLLLTTIVALVIVVIRLYGQLGEQKARLVELLQKGGILQVGNPDTPYVVKVDASGELETFRWRVYVPKGRTVMLNARLEQVPNIDPPAPRLPPNAIVLAERAAHNPLQLSPGEHVVSLYCRRNARAPRWSDEVRLDVVGDGPRTGRTLYVLEDLNQFGRSSFMDISNVENTKKIAQQLSDGHTLALPDGKTIVLCRFRERWEPNSRRVVEPTDPTKVIELLVWLHADGR